MNKQIMTGVLLTALMSPSAQAIGTDDDEGQDNDIGHETTGAGIGAIIGAIIGGPPGLIIGAAAGALIGRNERDPEDYDNQQAFDEVDMETLQTSVEHDEQERTLVVASNNVDEQCFHKAVLRSAPVQTSTLPALSNEFVNHLVLTIQFRTDSGHLEPHFRKQLFGIATAMGVFPGLHVYLSGHADRRGTEKYNMSLSSQRIKSVVNILNLSGWTSDRIHTSAQGESSPLSNEGDNEAYPFDRRVLITFAKGGSDI